MLTTASYFQTKQTKTSPAGELPMLTSVDVLGVLTSVDVLGVLTSVDPC